MSKPTKKDELAAIDPVALHQVTGGTSSDTSGLISQLTGILDSVKSINKVSSQNGINPQEMMLFMMLMQQRNQSQQTVQVAAAPPWWPNRWSF